MTAPNVSVPAPDFVSDKIGVAIGSDTTTLPAPTKVMVGVPVDAPNAEPDATLNVSAPSSLPIDELAASVTAPVIEFVSAPAVDTLRITPVEELPVPDTVNGSGIESPVPDTFTAAPELTVVPELLAPNDDELLATAVPLEIVVAPV